MSLVGRFVAVAATLLVALAGCTEQPGVGVRLPTQTPTVVGPESDSPTGTTVAQDKLVAQKAGAQIADCPISDARVATVPRGLPDIVLPCLGGGRAVRLAGLRGQPMMISVWAQWCTPCRAEAPFLSQVAAQNTTDLMILGVDFVDPRPDKALEFAQLSGWRYPQLADTDKALAAPLQLTAPPQTLFVRSDGTIAYRQYGPLTSATQIRDLARQHLGVIL